jgi:hypothetical protein
MAAASSYIAARLALVSGMVLALAGGGDVLLPLRRSLEADPFLAKAGRQSRSTNRRSTAPFGLHGNRTDA